MAGGVMRTAVERERAAAEDREAEDRAERSTLRSQIEGGDLATARPGVYTDIDGDEWTRRPVGEGAVAHAVEGDVEWPESELDDVDDQWGPFRWCGR